MRPQSPTESDHGQALAAWATRHRRHGIARAELDAPMPWDDPGAPRSGSVYLAERPDVAAYMLVQDGPIWAVWCHARGCTVATGADPVAAVQAIRPDRAPPRPDAPNGVAPRARRRAGRGRGRQARRRG